jgi:hypothetical protein
MLVVRFIIVAVVVAAILSFAVRILAPESVGPDAPASHSSFVGLLVWVAAAAVSLTDLLNQRKRHRERNRV